jgi:hypothetical protein
VLHATQKVSNVSVACNAQLPSAHRLANCPPIFNFPLYQHNIEWGMPIAFPARILTLPVLS